MVQVYYDEYTNDYCKRDKDRRFYDLSDFKDWFFGLCKGDYERYISIPNPDSNVWKEGPSCMEVNCMWTDDKIYRIHMIKKDGAIIYSDGRHTNRIKHWNEIVKNMCRDMLARKKNPQFNFG